MTRSCATARGRGRGRGRGVISSESEVEHKPAEMVADKPATNGTTLYVVWDTLTPTPDAAPAPMSNLRSLQRKKS